MFFLCVQGKVTSIFSPCKIFLFKNKI
jgi:hypothetical protein